MAEPGPDSRIRTLRIQRERGLTGPWTRGRGLTTAALVCFWLAALASCDAMKSEQNAREYVHELVTELCAPGAFYRECWWQSAEGCHREMPTWVVNSLPTYAKRLQPSEALRRHIFERLFFFHSAFLNSMMSPAFEKEVCMDETLWKHVPPGEVGVMAELRAAREMRRRQRRDAPSTPTTTTTPPEPPVGGALEPSPLSRTRRPRRR